MLLCRTDLLPLSGLLLGTVMACSPASGSSPDNGALSGGGGAPAWPGVGGGTGNGGGSTGDPPVLTLNDAGVRKTIFDGPDGSCAATSAKVEQVIVETQVPVTTQVTTQTPVAIYFMQDQSGSMIIPGTIAFPIPPTKWAQTQTALTTFVNDPASTGIDVALQYFALATPACDGSGGYATPEVPMAPLPGNAQAIVSSLNAHLPSTGTPIEPALRGVTSYCITYQDQHPNERCVAVLITDGAPSACNGDPAALAQIAGDAYTQHNVITFTIGMDGADYNMLNGIAAAGHGDCTPNVAGSEACNVGTGGNTSFIDALNTIRGTVTKSETHFETHQEIQQTKLACEFKIPAPPNGLPFDKNQVNVLFTNAAGKETVYQVATVADCTTTPHKAWYYDDPNTPTKILVCPQTCSELQAGDGGVVLAPGAAPRVDILLGCVTKHAPPA